MSDLETKFQDQNNVLDNKGALYCLNGLLKIIVATCQLKRHWYQLVRIKNSSVSFLGFYKKRLILFLVKLHG